MRFVSPFVRSRGRAPAANGRARSRFSARCRALWGGRCCGSGSFSGRAEPSGVFPAAGTAVCCRGEPVLRYFQQRGQPFSAGESVSPCFSRRGWLFAAGLPVPTLSPGPLSRRVSFRRIPQPERSFCGDDDAFWERFRDFPGTARVSRVPEAWTFSRVPEASEFSRVSGPLRVSRVPKTRNSSRVSEPSESRLSRIFRPFRPLGPFSAVTAGRAACVSSRRSLRLLPLLPLPPLRFPSIVSFFR